MTPKAEKAFNAAFNKVDAKAKTDFRIAMNKATFLRDRANAIEAEARAKQSDAFKAAMSAGNRAAWNADRSKAKS